VAAGCGRARNHRVAASPLLTFPPPDAGNVSLRRKIVTHAQREVRLSDAAAVAGESRVVTGLNRSGFVEVGGLEGYDANGPAATPSLALQALGGLLLRLIEPTAPDRNLRLVEGLAHLAPDGVGIAAHGERVPAARNLLLRGSGAPPLQSM
jgi:hypothetical protein